MPGTIKYLDLTLPSPAENLALDEALLGACDRGGEEVLRCWESPEPFVVVGLGKKVAADVDVPACDAESIPILRRCSGGGTVLQGPGCLNFTLLLRTERAPALGSVSGTNQFVMQRHREMFAGLTGQPVAVAGHTDLVIGGRKFSGNAQRRLRHALLFHGTALLDFDLAQAARLLLMPPLQPDYRARRPHQEFITNIGLERRAVKRALQECWGASSPATAAPLVEAAALAREKYARPEWNRKL